MWRCRRVPGTDEHALDYVQRVTRAKAEAGLRLCPGEHVLAADTEVVLDGRILVKKSWINVTPRETRVAVVENGMLQEVHIERGSQRGYVGNIYKGKVQRVMPGMQAAFVDIGLDRAAFLHASDIVRRAPTGRSKTARTPPSPTPPINELLRDGQEIVVQVVKDPIGSKGARLTTQTSASPRATWCSCRTASVLGVSVRIEDDEPSACA
jgi:ribonuclease G